MPRPLIPFPVLSSLAVLAGPSLGHAASPSPAAAPPVPPVLEPTAKPSASVVGTAHKMSHHRRATLSASAVAVVRANAAATMQPTRAGYIGAIQIYPFSESALYQLYAAPGEITDIALEAGETLSGTGPVAAGDTVRWIIGDTESGSGAARRIHILVKPTDAGLATNLVIDTDRRTYHVEMRSTPSTYMASLSWTYPEDALIAIKAQAVEASAAAAAKEAAAPIASGVDLEALNFRYRIDGKAPWRPLRVFDDGRQTFIQFPPSIAQGDMPPLWVAGPAGAELVNYRVRGPDMIVDRLFDRAELRLGGKHQQVIRILREGGGRARP